MADEKQHIAAALRACGPDVFPGESRPVALDPARSVVSKDFDEATPRAREDVEPAALPAIAARAARAVFGVDDDPALNERVIATLGHLSDIRDVRGYPRRPFIEIAGTLVLLENVRARQEGGVEPVPSAMGFAARV